MEGGGREGGGRVMEGRELREDGGWRVMVKRREGEGRSEEKRRVRKG